MRKHINPSEIWQQENENFSSWLGKNLKLLDGILNTQLDLERPVGPFFADLLCRNTVDDSLVIIENQLERTDDKHLGQLLTYVTELQTHTIIWIATDFENKHQHTLNLLNDNMNDTFMFFGIQLVLKPIDDSSYTPKFTLIAGPRDRCHQRTHDRSESTSKDRSEPSYWSAFREYWAKGDNALEPWEWSEDRHPDYFGFHIENLNDIWFAAWRRADGKKIAAKLFMDSKASIPYFDRLKEQQHAIDFEFGPGLIWDPNPNFSPYPQVGPYTDVVPDKARWSEQFEWLRITLEKLDNIFRERISKCTRSNQRSPTTEPHNKSYQQKGSHPPINDSNNLVKRYWSEFQKYCDDKGMSLAPLPPERQTDNYYGFYIEGVPDGIFWLAAWRHNKGTQIAVNLHLRLRENVPQTIVEQIKNIDALDAFDTLKKQKETIENSFGGSLKWNRHPTFPSLGPLVGLSWKPDSTDESDWPHQFEWMHRNLEKLNRVFRPFIQDMISLV